MSKLKIIIQDEVYTSDSTTDLALPIFLDYGGASFPDNQWTDFADILNMWTCQMLKYMKKCKAKFALFFMDGPYRMDVSKDKDMKLTVQCVNFRNDERVELSFQCEYVELLEAVYEAVKQFSGILYEKSMYTGKYESVYNQSLLTRKWLKAAIDKIN